MGGIAGGGAAGRAISTKTPAVLPRCLVAFSASCFVPKIRRVVARCVSVCGGGVIARCVKRRIGLFRRGGVVTIVSGGKTVIREIRCVLGVFTATVIFSLLLRYRVGGSLIRFGKSIRLRMKF